MLETNFPLKTPETVEAIHSWWSTFDKHREDLHKQFQPHSTHGFDVAEFMHQHFAKINKRMCWEYGPSNIKDHLLAIAPERRKDLEPLARLICSLAPEYENFEIVVNRQPEDWNVYMSYTDGRFQWSGADGILFDIQNGQNNLFDIVFHVPHNTQSSDIYSACYITCETLLGEDIMSKWVGFFDVQTLPKKSLFSRLKADKLAHLKPLKDLRQTLASKIAHLKNNLQAHPYAAMTEETHWSLLSMEPKDQQDYEPLRDMITSVTPSTELFNAYYSNRDRFYSERFSKFGEQFIFLQLDGSADDLDQQIFGDRGEIEDALDAALIKNTVGKVIGGGTGRKYSYIHFAVTDLQTAIESLKRTLRNEKCTRRAWIMFHDANRQQEWIDIWDDTPAPKLPTIE